MNPASFLLPQLARDAATAVASRHGLLFRTPVRSPSLRRASDRTIGLVPPLSIVRSQQIIVGVGRSADRDVRRACPAKDEDAQATSDHDLHNLSKLYPVFIFHNETLITSAFRPVQHMTGRQVWRTRNSVNGAR